MEHCLILTERTVQRDAELSAGGEGKVNGREEKDTQVLFFKKHTKYGNKILIFKSLLLTDYNMSSCAVDLQQESDADV